jgi:hypothetical protein
VGATVDRKYVAGYNTERGVIMGAWSRLSFGSTLTAHGLDRLPSAWSQGPEGPCVYGSVVADLGLDRCKEDFGMPGPGP